MEQHSCGGAEHKGWGALHRSSNALLCCEDEGH